jgi:U6 snRNA-associated Sm-like protein LSm6
LWPASQIFATLPQNLTNSTFSSEMSTPSEFLKDLLGNPVVVKLNSGVDYRGILSCLDGYMNIALEQTEEYVNTAIRSSVATTSCTSQDKNVGHESIHLLSSRLCRRNSSFLRYSKCSMTRLNRSVLTRKDGQQGCFKLTTSLNVWIQVNININDSISLFGAVILQA